MSRTLSSAPTLLGAEAAESRFALRLAAALTEHQVGAANRDIDARLGFAHDQAMAGEAGQVFLSDFARYAPDGGKPASFIAAPVFSQSFLIGVRFPFYLAIGASRMSFARFLLVDSVCVAAVVASFFGLSYVLGERYGEAVFDNIHRGHVAFTLTAIGVAIVAFFVWQWRSSRNANGASASE